MSERGHKLYFYSMIIGLRVRVIWECVQLGNLDLDRPSLGFFITSFFGISAEKYLKNCYQEQRPSCTRTRISIAPCSGIRQKFSRGIRNASLWIPESHERLESGIQVLPGQRLYLILQRKHAAKTIIQESAIDFFSFNWVAGSLLITPQVTQFQEPIRSTCTVFFSS